MSGNALTQEAVLQALRRVQEPDLGRDLVSLGFVKDVQVSGGRVALTVELPTPLFPEKRELERECREAVAALPGAERVEVRMTSNIPGRARQADKMDVPGAKNLIAVASGKGGVGKSTVAVNLAVALKEAGATVGVMDSDMYGPSMPLMLGIDGRPEGTADNKIYPMENYGLKVMSIGFLVGDDSPVIWRGPMVMKGIQQFLGDTLWGELDYLVIDLPPGTGDAQLTVVQTVPLTGAVIVTTPQEIALLDARKGLVMFQRVDVPILGIIENMGYHLCPKCGHREDIFDSGGGKRAAEGYGVPFLGSIPLDTRVRLGGDRGRPVVLDAPASPMAEAFRKAAAAVAAQVSIHHFERGLATPELKVIS
ncbi:MAG: iron-sulfur cluster carrier protein ApbC [Nitrospinota bacterium]